MSCCGNDIHVSNVIENGDDGVLATIVLTNGDSFDIPIEYTKLVNTICNSEEAVKGLRECLSVLSITDNGDGSFTIVNSNNCDEFVVGSPYDATVTNVAPARYQFFDTADEEAGGEAWWSADLVVDGGIARDLTTGEIYVDRDLITDVITYGTEGQDQTLVTQVAVDGDVKSWRSAVPDEEQGMVLNDDGELAINISDNAGNSIKLIDGELYAFNANPDVERYYKSPTFYVDSSVAASPTYAETEGAFDVNGGTVDMPYKSFQDLFVHLRDSRVQTEGDITARVKGEFSDELVVGESTFNGSSKLIIAEFADGTGDDIYVQQFGNIINDSSASDPSSDGIRATGDGVSIELQRDVIMRSMGGLSHTPNVSTAITARNGSTIILPVPYGYNLTFIGVNGGSTPSTAMSVTYTAGDGGIHASDLFGAGGSGSLITGNNSLPESESGRIVYNFDVAQEADSWWAPFRSLYNISADARLAMASVNQMVSANDVHINTIFGPTSRVTSQSMRFGASPNPLSLAADGRADFGAGNFLYHTDFGLISAGGDLTAISVDGSYSIEGYREEGFAALPAPGVTASHIDLNSSSSTIALVNVSGAPGETYGTYQGSALPTWAP